MWWCRVVAGLCALILASTSCYTPPRPVRYAGLEAFAARPFHFEHGIELLRVKNGMTIALVPDARTNLVTVDVRYLVGAAEDPPGRAGMAHLVEHLMFEARAADGEPTLGDRLGDAALSYNAWTHWDETHYTTTALADRLDEVLEVEARRLELTCDQLDEAVFLRERDVVLEEAAERQDGLADLHRALTVAVFGVNHPYARPIGGREIADATRAEACAFIDGHYAPDRAILVVNGRFDVDAVSRSIAKRFGPIARRSSLPRVAIDPPDLEGFASEHTADIDEATAIVFFERPAWAGEGGVYHDFAARLLGSELAELDRERAWITSAAIDQLGGWRQRVMAVFVSVADPERLDDAVEQIYQRVEHLFDDESNKFVDYYRGAVQTDYAASYDSFLRRGPWIADFLQYTDDNMFMLREMALVHSAKRADVVAYVQRTWTRDRSNVARIRPSGAVATEVRATVASSGRDHDLQPWRTPVDAAEATRPLDGGSREPAAITRFELPNGLQVLMTPDPDSAIVDARIIFPVGSAADPDGRPGVASLAASLLGFDTDREYERNDLLRIDWALSLGTQTAARVDETTTTFGAAGLALFADWHLWRLFWLLDLGVYDGDDVAAMHARARELADDDDEVDVRSTALRARLFGADHPYAAPPTDPAVLLKIGAGDLGAFRRRYYRARGATLVISGAFDPAALRAEIESLFGSWSGDAPPAAPPVPPVTPARGPSWLAVADEDETQGRITVAFSTRSNQDRDRAARMILAEMIEDRVRVVREGLGASYGVAAGYAQNAGGGALFLDSSVDPERAGKALAAMLDAAASVRDDAAGLAEDFVRGGGPPRRALAQVLADSAGASAVAAELEYIAANQLPLDHFEVLARQVSAATPEDVAAVAAKDLAEARMVVVVSGRRKVVEAALSDGAPAGTKIEWLAAK